MKLILLPIVFVLLALIYCFHLFNYYFLVILIITILGFVFYNWSCHYKYFIAIVLILMVIIIFIIQSNKFTNLTTATKPLTMQLKIIAREKTYYIAQKQNSYYFIWISSLKVTLNVGDQIIGQGRLTPVNVQGYYWWNYYGKLINGQIIFSNQDFKFISDDSWRTWIWKQISRYDQYHLIKVFFLQNYHEDFSELFSTWKELNISHLLIISGFHVSLQISFLKYFVKKIFKKTNFSDLIIFCWLINYLYLLNWQISAMRASLFWLFKKSFTYYKIAINDYDIWAIVVSCFLIKNPRVIFQISWQLSFLISLVILISLTYTTDYHKFIKYFFQQLMLVLFICPINIYFQGYFNVFIIFHQLLFNTLFQIFYYVFLILFWIKPLHFLIFYLLSGLLMISLICKEWTIFYNLMAFGIGFYFFYYLTFISLLVIWKQTYFKILNFLVYFEILIYWFLFPKSDASLTVHMIDVGHALSIFVKLPFDQGNYLYDVGIQSGNSENSKILNYLRKNGINTIDAVFISHNHQDHNNNLKFLQKNIKIKTVITNQKSQSKYKFANITFYNWSFYYYDYLNSKNENNRSLVLYWKYNTFQFLFTGDIEIQAEKELIKYIDILHLDYLQIAHHGSNTSSSSEFLQKVNPKFCAISNNQNVKSNTLDSRVINRLENINCLIYPTSTKGTIIYKVMNNKYAIETLKIEM